MNGRDRSWLAVLFLLFLAWRLPLMSRTVAGQDEDWFAVAGVTILRTGVPQIPYIPSREPSACYKADVALYALPPLSFYLQALVHLILGDGLGPARMASALEGLVACSLVYDLARFWTGRRRVARLATLAYLICRPFYFSATTARPDMAAVMFGLLAIRFLVWHRRDPRRRSLVAAGVAAGASLLAHPFGVVPTVQVGLALLAGPGGWRRRIGELVSFGAIAALVFGLWLPLILLHPDIFRIQFGANVLHRAGPGLGATLLAPWSVLAYQTRQFVEFATLAQALLLGAGVLCGIARGRREPGGGEIIAHLGASILLLALFEGRHPTLGYYAYPTALASIGVGMLADAFASKIEGTEAKRRGPMATASVVGLLLLALLPGSGLRPWLAQIRHWNDPAYDARRVANSVMADVPTDALTAVDGAYVLDAHLAGRNVVDLTIDPLSYDVRTIPFEYAVFSKVGLRLYKPDMADLDLVKTYGNPGDSFAPYAELYRRAPSRASRP